MTTEIIFGHVVEKEEGKLVRIYTASGNFIDSAVSIRDAYRIICNREACEYNGLKPDLIRLLKDYSHKLEIDDLDPAAIGKMKDVAALLDVLQEGV